jgi:hypothetical protein
MGHLVDISDDLRLREIFGIWIELAQDVVREGCNQHLGSLKDGKSLDYVSNCQFLA